MSELLIVACNVITCLHTWVTLFLLANNNADQQSGTVFRHPFSKCKTPSSGAGLRSASGVVMVNLD